MPSVKCECNNSKKISCESILEVECEFTTINGTKFKASM